MGDAVAPPPAQLQPEHSPPPSRLAARREGLSLALVITQREVRDTLRDWRLVVPIIMLTLAFPLLLNVVASLTLGFVRQYRADVFGEQAIPFLLLVVGFFPISFSLVIALETFVGEKERQSLEPLLATPVSDTQLYVGKTLAALLPPLVAAYVGITVYLAGLYFNINYLPGPLLVLQILMLTTAEALVMVSAAVIISSRTTSVRAANLLASFVILPVAFLVQWEALLLFWRHEEQLWAILSVLLVVEVILVRMGIRTFNREALLGKQLDKLDPGRTWRQFKSFLREPPTIGLVQSGSQAAAAKEENEESAPTQSRLVRYYRHDLPQLLRLNRGLMGVVLLGLAAAVFIGWAYAQQYPLPPSIFALEDIGAETFDQYDSMGVLPSLSTWGILSNNVLSLLLAGALAIISFGSLAVVLLMAPIATIAFLAAQVTGAGYNPLVFLGSFVLPHAVVELPAAIIATAAAVRLGVSIMSPAPGMTSSQSWLQALAQFIKLFVLVVLPLLAVAALIEVYITPQLVVAVYGN